MKPTAGTPGATRTTRWLASTACVAAAALSSGCLGPVGETRMAASESPAAQLVPAQANAYQESITVMTLNLAHGRGDGFHQFLQGEDRARRNLDAVSTLVAREQPQLVAMQEADGPSLWSGGFDHVAYVARGSGYEHHLRGTHDAVPSADYGTALMGRLPLDDGQSIGFQRSITPTHKGFVVGRTHWPGDPTFELDVVSVHLDPMSTAIRKAQADELRDLLTSRGRPVILMGDFNSDYRDLGSAAKKLARDLGLSAWEGTDPDAFTHRRVKRYVDWVLVSDEFVITGQRALPDVVSDHLGVVATVTRRTTRSAAEVARTGPAGATAAP